MLTSQSYANEKSFNTYVKYLAIKKHFSTDGYDYHKYNGKVRASFDKFVTRPDVYFFFKLSNMEDSEGVLLSNMIVNSNSWIREIVEDTGERNYLVWKKRKESLTYTFKSELNKLLDDYKDNFEVKGGQHPHIMSLYLQKQISLETITILSHFANIFEYWEQNIVDKIVAKDIIRLLKKYKPFLEINQKKYKEIIKNHFF